MSRIAKQRLAAQHVTKPALASPRAVVAHMLALQAQDLAAATWAVGLRMERSTAARVEAAIDRGDILRTWPMRSTLHFVAARDARWMVELLAPRALARSAARRRELGLTPKVIEKARRTLVRALRGGGRLSRADAYATLDAAGVRTRGQRGIHLIGHLAQEGTLCVGPRDGKQPAVVLLDEWAPGGWRPRSRDAALRELARRYIRSHGPARADDLAWWAGLSVGGARAALHDAGASIVEEDGMWRPVRPRRASARSPAAHLLPAFDELAVAYKDRSAALERVRGVARPQVGLLSPSVVVDGQMVGTWARTRGKGAVTVDLKPLCAWTSDEREAVEAAAERYAAFLGERLVLKR